MDTDDVWALPVGQVFENLLQTARTAGRCHPNLAKVGVVSSNLIARSNFHHTKHCAFRGLSAPRDYSNGVRRRKTDLPGLHLGYIGGGW